MKKYIRPQIECYEFECIKLIAGSSDDNVSVGTGGNLSDQEGGVEWNSRNDNSNDLWNSGW